MPFIDLLQRNPEILALGALVLGLIIGSFLNVLIYRLPVMMQRQWKQECAELLGQKPQTEEKPFNLMTPGSCCPDCGKAIRPIENIPVFSYLLLRGRCSGCGNPISIRYPVIELLTGLLSAWTAWHFGLGWQMAAALLFGWLLIALAFIDIDHQLLPDNLVLPLMWGGLLLSIGEINGVSMRDSLIGAAAGYLSLWLVYHLFRLATGKEGMGYGDFKLLAALGAWMGWQMLPLIIILSAVVGAVVGIALILLGRQRRGSTIPFGPFLALAGLISLFWGRSLMNAYLGFTGL